MRRTLIGLALLCACGCRNPNPTWVVDKHERFDKIVRIRWSAALADLTLADGSQHSVWRGSEFVHAEDVPEGELGWAEMTTYKNTSYNAQRPFDAPEYRYAVAIHMPKRVPRGPTTGVGAGSGVAGGTGGGGGCGGTEPEPEFAPSPAAPGEPAPRLP